MKIRRSRFYPESKGAYVGSPRHIEVLDLLQQYDCLPSNYIRAAIPSTYTQPVLNLLNQEGYIGVPEEAKHHINARYRPTVFELLPKGEQLLKQHELWHGRVKSSGHFRHKFMVSCVLFSFHRACTNGITFKTEDAIVALAPWKPMAKDRSPSAVPIGDTKIIPDAPMFGLTLGKHTMHFHGFEADRGTEPLTATYDRQNITSKVQNYGKYLKADLPKKRYGLQRITILFVTLSSQRARAIQTIIQQEGLTKHIHVKSIPDFLESFPPPTDHIVRDDWLDGFNILNTLEATRERTEIGKGLRANPTEKGHRPAA